MIKRIIPIALLSAVFFSLGACKPKSHKLPGGLEYTIVKDAKGTKKAATGDVVEVHIVFKADDSTIANSREANGGKPVPVMIQPSQMASDWVNALTYLTPGDSAVITVSMDSVKKAVTAKGGQLPPIFEKAKKLTYLVSVVAIKNQQELQAEQEKMMQEAQAQSGKQMQTDDKLLQDYFAANGVKATKTSSGLYYVIEKEGTGPTPTPGQAVTVNYTGRTLDGKAFDSNVDPQFQHVEPFTFPIGQGAVIPGWDEGVALMKKGGKGKLYIPSPLAYGPNSPNPAIPANGILIFDVEVKEIAAAAPQQQQPPVQ